MYGIEEENFTAIYTGHNTFCPLTNITKEELFRFCTTIT